MDSILITKDFNAPIEQIFELLSKHDTYNVAFAPMQVERIKDALDVCDVVFLAFPTPPGEDGSADLSYVIGGANQIGELMTSYKVIISFI